MAEKHPYMSGGAGIVQAVTHLRNAFPAVVTSETLKKLGIAPNNETYVMNVLRFVKVLDEEGKKTDEAKVAFTKHADEDFQNEFAVMVQNAYADLFGLHGDHVWDLPNDKLISYFRSTDHTSAIVGQRQAGVFQTLKGLCGRGQATTLKSAASGSRVAAAGTKVERRATPRAVDKKQISVVNGKAVNPAATPDVKANDVGLTVRIEINLPASGDQATYDRIFKSIRENLINAQ
jgi:hypothetical protein